MQPAAVIFDLDGTLLDTSALDGLRTAGDWNEVKRRLDLVRRFPSATVTPDSVAGLLKAMGIRVGIVTHSPRWYAESLLQSFEIPYDVLLTGSDGFPKKPEPDSHQAAVERMAVNAAACISVGDLGTDFTAAALAGIRSVGVSWSTSPPASWRRSWPDVALNDPSLLLRLHEFDALRPYGEAQLTADVGLVWHWGSMIRVSDHENCLGRYFPTTDAKRFGSSKLSNALLAAKNDPDSVFFDHMFVGAYYQLAYAEPDHPILTPNLVTSVPPSPDAPFDRYASAINYMLYEFDMDARSDLLQMAFAVPGYKKLDFNARAQANVGRFNCASQVQGSVLLVDDILTSPGGQARACADELIRAGATAVQVLTVGLTQEPLRELCPECGSAFLKTYDNSHTGEKFLGCPSWNKEPPCRYTLKL